MHLKYDRSHCKQILFCPATQLSVFVDLTVFSCLSDAGGCRAVLSEAPAGRARGPAVRGGEGGRRHRGPELPAVLQGGDLLG